MGNPAYDPHGDPIPDSSGNIKVHYQQLLSQLKSGEGGKVLGVKDSSSKFLQHLDTLGIKLGSEIKITERHDFDVTVSIVLEKKKNLTISKLVAQNIFIG